MLVFISEMWAEDVNLVAADTGLSGSIVWTVACRTNDKGCCAGVGTHVTRLITEVSLSSTVARGLVSGFALISHVFVHYEGNVVGVMAALIKGDRTD